MTFLIILLSTNFLTAQKFIGDDPLRNVLPDEQYLKLVEEIRQIIPKNQYSDFKSKSSVIWIKINQSGAVDSADVLISTGSSKLDSIFVEVISSNKYNFPNFPYKLDKNIEKHVEISIPITREQIIGKRKNFWRFLPFIN